jgi:hypothetical protein
MREGTQSIFDTHEGIMPNTLITPTKVLRKSLMILHQKLNFIGTIFTGYDDQFAQDGAKIGDTLKIRMPNKYVVNDGADITSVIQDTAESTIDLKVDTQKNVAMGFGAAEQTLSLDDFSDRIIDPAMSVLAAASEADGFGMFNDVPYQVGTFGTVPNTLLTYLQANGRLTNSLAPMSQRAIQMSPDAMVTIVDALKGLFQDSQAIAKQYREGLMGRTAGADWYQNTLTPRWTAGNKVSGLTVSGGSQTGSSLLVGGSANLDTFKKGTVFTISGVNEVHPETKQDTGRPQQFVITADVNATTTTVTWAIYPAIVTSGALKTVTASPSGGAPITLLGTPTASTAYPILGCYHKTAFTMGFVDLDMPKGVDFGAREVMDDISMRIVRQYDVKLDKKITRLDILYGKKAVRPDLACRIAS